jgi:hypothetical protein
MATSSGQSSSNREERVRSIIRRIMKMEHRKVLILIGADGTGYQDLVRAIRETWGSSKLDGFEILYYYGYRENYPRPEPGHCIQVNDELICGVESNDVKNRNKIAFEYIYTHYDFEYMFRCCSGSYIVQERLEQFLQDKPKTRFYCGHYSRKGISKEVMVPFVIGFNILLSKDLVKLLVDNPSGYFADIDEDVAIGKFLVDKGILITKAPTQYRFLDIQDLDKNQHQYQYHIRRNVPLMYELHRKLVLENEVK